MPHYLDDIRSDMSVLHRIEDIEHLPAPRFFSYCTRLSAYQGAVSAVLRRRQAVQAQRKAQPPVGLGEWARSNPDVMRAAYEQLSEGR